MKKLRKDYPRRMDAIFSRWPQMSSVTMHCEGFSPYIAYNSASQQAVVEMV
jgi:hypothetical protein